MKRKLDTKHKADQKQLYAKYYNDVYALQEQNAKLAGALQELGYNVR